MDSIDKQKAVQLHLLLGEAQELLSHFEGGYSDHFFSAADFHLALVNSIDQIKAGHNDQIGNLYLWFAPSYDWDDFTGTAGESLGNEIYNLLFELKNYSGIRAQTAKCNIQHCPAIPPPNFTNSNSSCHCTSF